MASKKHKELIEAVKNKLHKHNCKKESPIYRRGWRFLDLECYPHDSKLHKPTAVEVENGSSKLQRESNFLDLREWKKKNPDGVTFQIERIEELDVNKLVKHGFRRF